MEWRRSGPGCKPDDGKACASSEHRNRLPWRSCSCLSSIPVLCLNLDQHTYHTHIIRHEHMCNNKKQMSTHIPSNSQRRVLLPSNAFSLEVSLLLHKRQIERHLLPKPLIGCAFSWPAIHKSASRAIMINQSCYYHCQSQAAWRLKYYRARFRKTNTIIVIT